MATVNSSWFSEKMPYTARLLSVADPLSDPSISLVRIIAIAIFAAIAMLVGITFSLIADGIHAICHYSLPTAEMPPLASPPAYSLDKVIDRVQTLSKELHENGEKLCLFIGRTPGEPFPGFGQEKEANDTWISLDMANKPWDRLDQTGNQFITTGKQLHLVMDMNNNDKLKKIQKLFDKIIVDLSTLKNYDDKDNAWYFLGKLLRPEPGSQLITETRTFYPIDEVETFMPENEYLRPYPIQYKVSRRYNEEFAKAKSNWLESNAAKRVERFKQDGYFSKVRLETESPFPYMYRTLGSALIPHFILSDPQPSIYEFQG